MKQGLRANQPFGVWADLWASRLLTLGALIILVYLGVCSFVYTVTFPPDGTEVPIYNMTWGIPAVLQVAAVLAVLLLLRRFVGLEALPARGLLFALLGYVLALGLAWVLLADAPVQADQSFLVGIAQEIRAGNFKSFRDGAYMRQYPHQMWMVYWLALLQSLFGTSPLVPQVVNALCCPLIFLFLYRLTQKLFADKSVSNVVLLLGFGLVPLVLYSTFVYGNIIALALAVAALDTLCGGLQRKSVWRMLTAGGLIALAIQFKQNSAVFLVGMLIIAALYALRTRWLRGAAAAAGLLLLVFLLNETVLFTGERMSGQNLHMGQPKSAHIAMGLQEGPLAPGWFNQYNDLVYLTHEFDPALTNAQAMEDVKGALLNFARNPGYAAWFFHTKTISQWSEPSFECFWVSFDVAHDEPAFITQLYVGKAHRAVIALMDGYQLLIFAFALVGILLRRKMQESVWLLPVLIMLGGFLFHTFWEAKGQYTLPYFTLLLPYAAAGLCGTVQALPFPGAKHSAKKHQ